MVDHVESDSLMFALNWHTTCRTLRRTSSFTLMSFASTLTCWSPSLRGGCDRLCQGSTCRWASPSSKAVACEVRKDIIWHSVINGLSVVMQCQQEVSPEEEQKGPMPQLLCCYFLKAMLSGCCLGLMPPCMYAQKSYALTEFLMHDGRPQGRADQ